MHIKEINELKSHQKRTIESLKNEFTEKIDSLDISNVVALSEIRSLYEEKLHSLQTQHSLTLDAIHAERDQLLNQQQREGELMMEEYVTALNK